MYKGKLSHLTIQDSFINKIKELVPKTFCRI